MSTYTKEQVKSAMREQTNQKAGGGYVVPKHKFGTTYPTPGNGINEPKKKSPAQ